MNNNGPKFKNTKTSPNPIVDSSGEYATDVIIAIAISAINNGGKLNTYRKYNPINDPIVNKIIPPIRTLLGSKSFSGNTLLPPLNGVGVVVVSIPLLKSK